MAYREVRFYINDPGVQSYIRPGGEVRDLVNDLAREAHALARSYLLLGKYGSVSGNHIRSGRLYGGTNWNRAKDSGPLSAYATLYNNANHVHYFMSGTTGPITGKGPWGYMLVPRKVGAMQRSSNSKGAGSELYAAWKARGKKGYRGFYRMDEVAGQKAKPFLEDAKDAAFISRGLFLR
jgi:hypothetical protein